MKEVYKYAENGSPKTGRAASPQYIHLFKSTHRQKQKSAPVIWSMREGRTDGKLPPTTWSSHLCAHAAYGSFGNQNAASLILTYPLKYSPSLQLSVLCWDESSWTIGDTTGQIQPCTDVGVQNQQGTASETGLGTLKAIYSRTSELWSPWEWRLSVSLKCLSRQTKHSSGSRSNSRHSRPGFSSSS